MKQASSSEMVYNKAKKEGAFLYHVQFTRERRGAAGSVDAPGRARQYSYGRCHGAARNGAWGLIEGSQISKGSVLEVAKIATIMAAQIIPLCHPLPMTHSDVQFQLDRAQV